jgi:hypothetical protein
MPNLLQSMKNFFDGTSPKPEVTKEIIQPENTQVSLMPFEDKLNVFYMGCYNVNPLNQVITQELGTVHNQKECINLGKNKGYQYVALQDGNLCLGTNNIDSLQSSAVSRNNCNMVCDESSAGFCGGIFKNQVYATSLAGAVTNEYHQQLVGNMSTSIFSPSDSSNSQNPPEPSKPSNPSEHSKTPNPQTENPSNKESFKHLENFASHNKEMNIIDKNISQIDMVCQQPINKYNILLSLLIVVLLTYIIIEMIHKKITI